MKTVLVTGANRGIGLAIARELVREDGFKVLGASRDMDAGRAAADETGAVPVKLDLSDRDEIVPQLRHIQAEHGDIDVLVNNAGVLAHGSGFEIEPEDLLHSLTVNALAPFILIRELGPGMKSRGWGRIVNLSTGLGSFSSGLKGPLAYSVSKAALNALTLSFSHDLGSSVKINAVCPGWVRTRMGGESGTRTPEKGAETPVWLATLPDDGPTGKFFRDKHPIRW